MSALHLVTVFDSESRTPARNAPSEVDSPAGWRGCGADDVSTRGGEHLRRSRAADGTERGPHQVTAADEDHRDGGRGSRELAARVLVRAVAAREQRHQRDQRNEGEVLEQQHGETGAPGGFCSRSRSASIGSTIAVEERAKPTPRRPRWATRRPAHAPGRERRAR